MRSALFAVLLFACGEIEGPVLRYGDPAALAPYPSNRYTVPADTPTGLRVSLPGGSPDLLFDPGPEGTIAALEALDGFSTIGGVIVELDAPVDVAGIARVPPDHPDASIPLSDARDFTRSDSPFILLDVDPASPERGHPMPLLPHWWEHTDARGRSEYILIVEPAIPLAPATRYLFVVTDALRSKDGVPASRTKESERLIEGDLEGAYAEEVGAALDELERAMGVDRDRVKLATTFTTASIDTGIRKLSALARSTPAPELLEPWTVATTTATDGRVRFRAVYAAPDYRTPLPDGQWHFDADGTPIVQDLAPIEVFLTFTDANSTAKKPVVIHAHGLGGSKDGSWDAAERLAGLDVAIIAIDAPHHGSRGGGSLRPDIGAVTRFFGLDPESVKFVLARARDNFRQNASDHLELIKLIRSMETLDLLPLGAPDVLPDLDTSRILYIGQSFGSVQGATVLALAPEISHAVWNVGGAGLMKMIRDSSLLSTIFVGALRPESASDGAVARSMAITQAVVDPGDPLNFARYVSREPLAEAPSWRPRAVLIQQVIDDAVVPASSTEALARATGLVLTDGLIPVSGLDEVRAPLITDPSSGVFGALSQFDRVEGGRERANHGNLISSPEARAQYVEFFRTALEGSPAVVAPPY